MKITNLLKYLLAPFFMYAGEEGGGAVDRGDDFVPTGDDAEADAAAQADADAEIARIAAEKAAEGKDDGKEPEGKEGEGDDKDGKKKDTRIPLARHKEMLDKARAERDALAAQVAQLQQGEKVAATNEQITQTETKLVGLEGEYNKLLADGEVEKAAAKMTEIRLLERSIGEQKSTMQIQAAEARAVERVRFDTVVERMESAYPALNPDHDDYDKEQVQDVLDLKETYERKGMSPSAALQKAVQKTLGAETTKQKTATEVTPQATKEAVAAARKEAANKTGLDAAGKTPPTAEKVGLDSDKIGGGLSAKAVMGMSQKEFAALDEAALSKLRGDTL